MFHIKTALYTATPSLRQSRVPQVGYLSPVATRLPLLIPVDLDIPPSFQCTTRVPKCPPLLKKK